MGKVASLQHSKSQFAPESRVTMCFLSEGEQDRRCEDTKTDEVANKPSFSKTTTDETKDTTNDSSINQCDAESWFSHWEIKGNQRSLE